VRQASWAVNFQLGWVVGHQSGPTEGFRSQDFNQAMAQTMALSGSVAAAIVEFLGSVLALLWPARLQLVAPARFGYNFGTIQRGRTRQPVSDTKETGYIFLRKWFQRGRLDPTEPGAQLGRTSGEFACGGNFRFIDERENARGPGAIPPAADCPKEFIF
jgi:hypothetical protein